jgi:putative hydrolase of the HAD superfamily
MIRGVLFDIDDTLYDSSQLAEMARRNSVKAMIDAGLSAGDEAEIYRLLLDVIREHGPNDPHHYDRLLETLGAPWDPKIIAAGVVAYEHTKMGYLKPYPGVIPTLLLLRQKRRLGIVSNGLSIKQWEKLIGLGIHHFFEVVVTSEAVNSEKPERAIFAHTLAQMGLAPEECVMVGDRPETDILGGNLSGLRTVQILRGDRTPEYPTERHRPTATITHLSELPLLLEGWDREKK